MAAGAERGAAEGLIGNLSLSYPPQGLQAVPPQPSQRPHADFCAVAVDHCTRLPTRMGVMEAAGASDESAPAGFRGAQQIGTAVATDLNGDGWGYFSRREHPEGVRRLRRYSHLAVNAARTAAQTKGCDMDKRLDA